MYLIFLMPVSPQCSKKNGIEIGRLGIQACTPGTMDLVTIVFPLKPSSPQQPFFVPYP